MEIEHKGALFKATDTVLLELLAAVVLNAEATVLLGTERVLVSPEEARGLALAGLKTRAMDLEVKPDRLESVERSLGDAKAKLDHALFDTPDVHDVEIPEQLERHMNEGETVEAAKVRLKKEWFDLCQRFIGASRGEKVFDPLTPEEVKKMNDLNIFAWG